MKQTGAILIFIFLGFQLSAQKNIYDIEHILEVKIYFKDKNWDQILDSLKQAGKEKRISADVVVDGKKYEDCGIRYKGNSSYFNTKSQGSNKLPFNIKFDYQGKDQALPGGLTKLKLANVFRDPSFLREVLSYEIAGKYMPAPKANYARVFANDVYLGLYNNTESVEEDFLDNYFGSSEGSLIKCDPNWHVKRPKECPTGDKASLMYLGEDPKCYDGLYELKEGNSFDPLIKLTKALQHKNNQIDTLLNVDMVLWMLAFNSVLVNLDSYTGRLCHNYYLYVDKKGKFHPLVWDMNMSFGGFRFVGLEGIPLRNSEMQELSPFVHYKEQNKKRPLITNLLGNNLFRKVYVAHIKTIVQETFANGAYLERGEKIMDLIDDYVKQDSNRLYKYDAFRENLNVSTKAGKQSIIGIKELMEKRSEYLMNHGLIKKAQPAIDSINHFHYDEEFAVNAKIEGANQAWLYYRYDKHGLFKKIQMFDDSGHNDQLEKDGIWGAIIPLASRIQYYIVAENESTAMLSPERASYEFYTFEKKTLNE